MKKLVVIGVALVLAVAGFLFLKVADGKRNDPEAVRARVNQYWEAVRINDQVARYQLMTGYAEGTLQPDGMRPQMSAQLKVLGYKVGKITLEEDGMAQVEVELEMTLPNFQGKGFTKKRRDTWSYVGDNWYRGMRQEYQVKSGEKKADSIGQTQETLE